VCLKGAQVCLKGAQVCLKGAQVCLKGAQVCLKGAQVCLKGQDAAPGSPACASRGVGRTVREASRHNDEVRRRRASGER
jgi:hypothetical protein